MNLGGDIPSVTKLGVVLHYMHEFMDKDGFTNGGSVEEHHVIGMVIHSQDLDVCCFCMGIRNWKVVNQVL